MENVDTHRSLVVDERWGWSLVALGFAVDALSKGGKAIFVVMVVIWGEEFGWSRSQLSLLGALVHISIAVMTPISGKLIDSYPSAYVIPSSLFALSLSYLFVALVNTYWQVIIAYGIFCGMSFGSINLNVFSTVVVNALPSDKRGFAVGIVNAGSTFGQFVFVPLFAVIVSSYGWRNCYGALACTTACLVIPAYMILPRDSQRKISRHNAEKHEYEKAGVMERGEKGGLLSIETLSTGRSEGEVGADRDGKLEDAQCGAGEMIVRATDKEGEGSSGAALAVSADRAHEDGEGVDASSHRGGLLIALSLGVSFFICGVTTTGFLETHLVALVVEKGLSLYYGGIAFSVISACNGAALVAVGYLTDRTDRRLLLAAIFGIRAGVYILLLLAFSSSSVGIAVLFIFSAIFGIVDYSVIPPVVSLVKSSFPHTVGWVVGVLLCLHSSGAAVGAAMGGWIYESERDYDMALVACTGLLVVATAVILVGVDEPSRSAGIATK